MKAKYRSKTNIVVSCWNALEYTKTTLESLFKNTHCPYFLTIVDNGSIDGTPDYLKKIQTPKHCEKYVLILNTKNKGSIGAINQGFKVSKQHNIEYTCLCNNDLFFQGNWLSLLEENIEKDNSIGILGTLKPAIDVQHHTKKISSKELVDLIPNSYSIEEELSIFQDGFSFEETCHRIVELNGGGISYLRCPPNAVINCCAIIRNSVSFNVKFLVDPRFKMYGREDIDLSWEIQKKGYKCAILKDVYIHHVRHKSINASNLNRDSFLLYNNKKLIKKWKNDLFNFLDTEKERGVDIEENFYSENNSEYFFLRRIQEKVDFLSEYLNNK